MTPVYFYATCLSESLFPDAALNGMDLLSKLGFKVYFPESQSCCGQPSYNSGFFEPAKKVAVSQMKAFSEPYPIIVPSASCAGMLKHQYAKLLNQSEWVENFSSRVWELSDFIAQNALKPWRALFHQEATEQKINKKRFSQLFNQSQARFSSLVSDEVIQHWASDDDHQLSIAIHHSCAALREMQVSQAVVTLLKTVPNIKLLQHQYSSECCGFGGTFAVKHPEISIMMAQDKCQHLADVQPDIIISQDNGCLMNIHGSWQHQPVLFRPLSGFLLDLALLMKP